MASGQKKNQPLVRGAAPMLDRFKNQVAQEIGTPKEYETGYWGDIPARECGAVGGHMTRRMIALAETTLVQQDGQGGIQVTQAPTQANNQTPTYQPVLSMVPGMNLAPPRNPDRGEAH